MLTAAENQLAESVAAFVRMRDRGVKEVRNKIFPISKHLTFPFLTPQGSQPLAGG